ncbi:hypothetical protein [Halalkalicoccus tibetensis]|uniref:Uncharacterized protein n=1 Tax=Halalkalicoccus tibetensis TaxID=175632 RepID=A0ABD5UY37_9EURY
MGPIAALRRPEHTGANRCLPCTVANGAILIGCCLVLALVRIPIAVVALLAGSGTIWLRGYLVPYTPQLLSRVRELTGRSREPDPTPAASLAAADAAVGERAVESLLGAGVLVPEGDRLHLDEGFRADWRDGIERLRTRSDGGLVEAVSAATDPGTDAELIAADRPMIALVGPDGGESWVSRPVAIAEVAAVRALDSHVADGASRERLAAARALRGFLDRCPVCDSWTEEASLRRCCGNRPRRGTVLRCPDCDEALYRFPDE